MLGMLDCYSPTDEVLRYYLLLSDGWITNTRCPPLQLKNLHLWAQNNANIYTATNHFQLIHQVWHDLSNNSLPPKYMKNQERRCCYNTIITLYNGHSLKLEWSLTANMPLKLINNLLVTTLTKLIQPQLHEESRKKIPLHQERRCPFTNKESNTTPTRFQLHSQILTIYILRRTSDGHWDLQSH